MTGLAAEVAAALAAGDPRPPAQLVGDLFESGRDRGARRAGGVFFTPPHLVDFVIDRTVGAALAGMTAAEALGLRVLDPACGAGAFLVAALDRIAAHVAAVRGGDPAALRRQVAARCLVGIDIDPAAVDACRLALSLAGGGDGGDLRTGDGLTTDVGRVDLVIGNPPWGQKRLRLPAEVAARYRARFRSARGVLDPFKLFVERAVELARTGWGMILPDIVLLKDQQAIRDIVLEQASIDWIVHAGRAFPGVNLDAAVVVARAGAPGPRHRVSIWHQLPATWREDPPPTHRQDQALYRRLPGHKLNIYLTDGAFARLTRLEAGPRLGQRFEIHEGVHTGNARAKLIVDRAPDPGCRPIVVGRGELARYRVAWAGAYLDTSPTAIDRAAGDYANLGRAAWHDAAKLVVRRTGDRVIAADDDRGLAFTNNAFVVIPRAAMSRHERRAYVALLNSRLMTWYFRTVQPRTGRLFAELKIQHLAGFPLPLPARWTAAAIAELAALADEGERAGDAAVAGRVDAAADRLFGLRGESTIPA